MDEEQYFIRRRGRVTGPYDYETIRKMVKTGKLYRSDELSMDQVDWATASETEFFPERKRPEKNNKNNIEIDDNRFIDPDESTTEPPGPSAPPSQAQWYYALNDQSLGPIKEQELKQQFQLRTIGPKTKVWCEGMAGWEDADRNEVFRSIFEQSGGRGTGGDRYCENCGNKVAQSAFICMNCGSKVKKGIDVGIPEFNIPNFTMPSSMTPSVPLEYAGLATIGQRWVAQIIDNILFTVIVFFESLIIFIPAIGLSISGDNESLTQLIINLSTGLVVIAGILTYVYYDAYLVSSEKMATPGKAMFNIAICKENGGRLSFGAALGRSFAKSWLSSILALGYILAFFNQKNQALHDMMVGSIVVQKK